MRSGIDRRLAAADCVVQKSARIEAPRALVAALAVDTNRWDRLFGLTEVSWTAVTRACPWGSAPFRVNTGTLLKHRAAWIEYGDYIEGHLFSPVREFTDGPLAFAGYHLLFDDDGPDATRVSFLRYVNPRFPLPKEIHDRICDHHVESIAYFFDQLARLAEAASVYMEAAGPGESIIDAARRALLQVTIDSDFFGSHTPTRSLPFEERGQRLLDFTADSDVAKRLLSFIASRPDDDVAAMRPEELAKVWGIDSRRLLRALLDATEAGLVDLTWQFLCPHCRVPSDSVPSLAATRTLSHCRLCDIDFDIDLATNAEVIFTANEAVRPVAPQLYCAGSPWFTPHVFSTLVAYPGVPALISEALPEGELLLRTVARGHTLLFDPQSESAGATIELTRSGFRVRPAADGQLHVLNTMDDQVFLAVERAAYERHPVLGIDLLSMPEYHSRFGLDSPPPGLSLSIGTATLMFTDLTNSTALFDRLGDARAFEIVQYHFDIIRQCVENQGGAVVKTMGDAVMACFRTLDDSLAAAIAAIRDVAAVCGRENAFLKVGMHQGVCLGVRANDRFDFFGSTVNLAARFQMLATANQIVMGQDSDEAAQALERERMRDEDLAVHHQVVQLRGVAHRQNCVILTVTIDDAGPG